MAIWSMKPLMQERIWGGRNLEKLGRIVPEGKKIGESWELVDRPEAQSVVVETGETLGSLWSGVAAGENIWTESSGGETFSYFD